MRRLMSSVVVLLVAIVFSSSVMAQETPTLVDFADDAYGLQGVIPDGWESIAPGIYARQSSPTDSALIAVQNAPVSSDAMWGALLPQLLLDAAPESSESLETAAFNWTLYVVDVAAGGLNVRVDVGMAEADGTTQLVLLQSPVAEYETLHEAVFLPVLESLTLLVDEEPVPYLVEEVTFQNGDVMLAGTLTLPEGAGQHPAVVLMTGTGPQDRDEMVVPGFRIFQLIADYLTRQGIAVLRYDDRGVGASTGNYDDTSIYDFASDGQAGVAYLKTRDDINTEQVGVLGHSEGGIYAAILGANPDSGVAFIISMAGTAIDGRDLLLIQNELILRDDDATDEQVQTQLDFLNTIFPLIDERDWETVADLAYQNTVDLLSSLSEAELAEAGIVDIERQARQSADAFIQGYGNESFATLLDYNPADDWAQTTVPVLGIFGELDIQVPPESNASQMEAALTAAGNEDFTIVVIENANHLFQDAITGGLTEYSELPKAFNAEFLPLVSDWLLERVDIVE